MGSPTMLKQVYRKIIHGQAVASLLPQNTCILCARILKSDCAQSFCRSCFEDLPWIETACHFCSLPLPEAKLDQVNVSKNSRKLVCGSCLKHAPYFDHSVIPFIYQYPISNLVMSLKYNEKLLYSKALSESLLKKIVASSSRLPELIIPVPLHPQRLVTRGFNQSSLIANYLAKGLKIDIDTQLCRRIKNTHQQTNYNLSQRKKNLSNAFFVDEKIDYQHIVIVDDVVTTGATANEMARVLKQADVQQVDIWACARTIKS